MAEWIMALGRFAVRFLEHIVSLQSVDRMDNGTISRDYDSYIYSIIKYCLDVITEVGSEREWNKELRSLTCVT